jgi:general stress protein 26
MAENETTKHLSELVDGGMIAMFMTMIGEEHSSRPLTVAEVEDRRISFLVDRTTALAEALDRPGTVVHVSIADVRKNVYLSLNGSASVAVDPATVERLWNPGAAAFFEGKDDPTIGVLRFETYGGEFWDAPGGGRLGAALATLKAAVTGDQSAAGDHGKVTTR